MEDECFRCGCFRYQTGALTPIVRWLSQGMQRAAAPPHPPRPAVRAENVAAARQGVENVAGAGIFRFVYAILEFMKRMFHDLFSAGIYVERNRVYTWLSHYI